MLNRTNPKHAEMRVVHGAALLKVIFVGTWADYEEIFISTADPMRFSPVTVNLRKQMQQHLGYRCLSLFSKKIASQLVFRSTLKAYPNALFLVNDNSEALLRFIVTKQPKADIAVVMRNPMVTKSGLAPLLRQIMSQGYPVFSFDKEDCRQYGFDFYRQYCACVRADPDPKFDFTFLGRSKGRRPVLEQLCAQLQIRGFSTVLRLTERSKGNKSFMEQIKMRQSKALPYLAYLDESLAARCLIDIVQCGQGGLTLRPLEAMLYRRKLLTNNRSVLNEEFYRPENIFVLGTDENLEGIESFMELPMVEIDNATKMLYSVDALITTVIDAMNRR